MHHAAAQAAPPDRQPPIIEVRNLNVWYDTTHALTDVSFDLYPGEVLAFIGPSGCGKSTALRSLNRMLDDIREIRIEGSIRMGGRDIYAPDIDPPVHRQRFGWVAQSPNPFPSSIYENVAYGARIHGLASRPGEMDSLVESCLRRADLWDEVKDILHAEAGGHLSVGQQQRLVIARALGFDPEVLLMDEPTGSIDPIATRRVEQLILDLRGTHAIIVVTHSMMEARRIADRVAMFYLGRLVEIGPVAQMFDHPRAVQTQNFIHGRTG
ncbi:phosphate ABC transporter ATP-binding protein [Fertoeibacter niger]|uniref:phosphate ABC transporter ATP-binding protein n=1 Tax=Fertoeibacter niger TaxID=2656921 RepID=UPI003B96B598